MCVEINGKAVARVVDQCDTCGFGQLSVDVSLAEKLGDANPTVKWRPVPCPKAMVDGTVQYRFKEGSSEWWMAVQIRNTKVPIESLQIKTANGDWIQMERQSYNYFVNSKQLGKGPFDFEMKDIKGNVVNDYGVQMNVGQVVQGKVSL